ncbi:MAG TPA: PEGA domain-containing protein [Rhodanobacteraceae bacterium]|jgi:hypothetical protein|nr:PEGA domain-containing protein [Rhodanobacteraceae bacterium]
MTPVDRHCRRWTGVAASALGLLVVAAPSGAQAPGTGTLRIESVPSGANVELIGGPAGVTPLTVTERDIYPNTYAEGRADMYGMVWVRHPGCEPLRHRVTADDIKQGLRLNLDCGVASAALETPPALAATPAAIPAATPTSGAAMLPERRLRQLQVLQELLDENLISPAEELRIRRRILQLKPPGG